MEDTEGAPDPLFGAMLLQDMMPSPTQLMQVLTDEKQAPSRCISLRITEVFFFLLRQMNWETLRESSPELHERSSSATSSSPHPENGRIVPYVLQLHYVVVGVSWFGHSVRQETFLNFHHLIFPCCLRRILRQPCLGKRWVVFFFLRHLRFPRIHHSE